ncbi:MAG: DUF1971 domain-containing protein, partial [Actinobacteria bacterium]|nr:DUF1971 domain-containing protein [Actinomycetota bacterium]
GSIMTSTDDELPSGLEHVRTTEVFDQDRHPAGLRRAHRVADGVWARLVVHSGELDFVFEDDVERPIRARADRPVVIPPGRLHHVATIGRVTFAIEFHRDPGHGTAGVGEESTGLAES